MKERVSRETIALRAAKEFPDGAVVNLGGGIPTLAANFVPEGRTVFFHTENGALEIRPTFSRSDGIRRDLEKVAITAYPSIRQACATRKHTTTPRMIGRNVATAVHFALPVSL